MLPRNMNHRFTCLEISYLHNDSAESIKVVELINKDLKRNDPSYINYEAYNIKHSEIKSKLPFNIWRFIQLVKLAVKP